jgi:lipopolysaccharide export system permease protein
MGSIGRYIFRTTLGAFLVVLVSVTLLMWITQALRNIDLMTNQGQSILVFVGITALIIPLLVLLMAPIALMIAVAHVLTKMSNDSELIVMNAAGMPPWQIFRPYLGVGIVVSMLVAAVSLYVSPECLHLLRTWATEVRTDFIANIVQPGRFTSMEGKLTFHIRERRPNGQLLGILVDDQRDPKERISILAEQGDILKNDSGTYLVLQTGTVQRQEAGSRDPAMVLFDRYAFDLSRLASGPQARYSVQERYFAELLDPSPEDSATPEQRGAIRAEIHNRLTAPLYPLAFLVVAFVFLGAPRTTRQSRSTSLVAAVSIVALLRTIGFVGTLAGAQNPTFLAVPYVVIAVTVVVGYLGITRGVIIEPPAFIANMISKLAQAWAERSAKMLGQAT